MNQQRRIEFEDLPANMAADLSRQSVDPKVVLDVVNEGTRTPPELDPRLELSLAAMSAEALKRIARRLCGNQIGQPVMAKAKEHIRSFWGDWHCILGQLRNLNSDDEALLGLLVSSTIEVSVTGLMAQFWMLGPEGDFGTEADTYNFRFLSFRPVDRLMEAGLVYRSTEPLAVGYLYSGYYYDEPRGIDGVSHLSTAVYTPESVTPWVGVKPYKPLEIATAEASGPGMMRRPVETAMRMSTLIEETRKTRKLGVRMDGQLSQSIYNTLTKKVSWLQPLTTDPLLRLNNPAEFYVGLLLLAGVLEGSYPEAYVSPDVDDLLALPFDEQARIWLGAYTGMAGWQEPVSHLSDYDLGGLDARMLPAMRQAIVLALSILPQADGWYRLSDFQEALFKRLAGRLALYSGTVTYHTGSSYRRAPIADYGKVREERTRRRWVAKEFPWIRAVLLGPLYQLGMVELQMEKSGDPTGEWLFRTTPLFRQCMLLEEPADEVAGPVGVPCWLVQPNFDVIVYADRASARQVALMNRIAQRVSSEGPVLTFRLTRDSVYSGFESGLSLETMLADLKAGAERPIPDSVIRTLQDWAARREQLQVIPHAALLEYRTTEERDAALAAGVVSGRAFDERMILVEVSSLPQARRIAAGVIDYLQDPTKCITAKEPAELKVDTSRADLYLRQTLPHFADLEDEGVWRITPQSLKRAATHGLTADGIMSLLSRYASRALPATLSYTLRSWETPAVAKKSIGLGSAIILTTTDKALAQALASSSTLRPYLGARLGDLSFAVEESKLEPLENALQSLGFLPGAAGRR